MERGYNKSFKPKVLDDTYGRTQRVHAFSLNPNRSVFQLRNKLTRPHTCISEKPPLLIIFNNLTGIF